MAVFTNQATLSYNGIVTSSNIVTGELVQVLSVTKTAVNDTYGAGDTVSYAVSIVNSGNVAFTDITLTDDLGAYEFGETALTPLTFTGDVLLYVDGVLQSEPSAQPGPPLVISGIDIPAGANAVVIYRAAVNPFAPPAGSITNTVTLSGAGITTPTSAQETVSASSESVLSISKAISPSTVAENGELTYTFIIENTGSTPVGADANAVVTDLFDPRLSDIVVTLNGAVLSSPDDYTYNEASGLFSTSEGLITVPAASYVQDAESGVWDIIPGTAVLTVRGTL
ncbi:MAG: hypothetical protein E7626_02705 [Ruminococcaceae bacterium]|nr:hypothetical protein [Oscillospiraceae bacterium]